MFLPGGSENLSNPDYSLDGDETQATRIGTLMQISDVIELDDGRLAMIVQGLERFEVVKASQHAPFAMASIRLLEDDEYNISSNNKKSSSAYMQDFQLWNEWEVLPTTWDKKNDDDDGPNQNDIIPISPLSNYNSQFFPDELSLFGTSSGDATNNSNNNGDA